ncbi:hypothetical protein [Kitasatospora sp. DSM 101779]|uniref:hypothetical protein n=1 Tax=Kitasatospora sp. DSM 101779 TaxID=2853165 RepID=UPI0021D84ED6|nr:hypothetical protein [Kitasatospora sp. DSM 101779]MCU7826854.1 hypothetical protein [Kitasatospora sp. DSM 101779]
MSETFAPRHHIVNAVVQSAGRSTLPFQQANAGRNHGTAFRYNHLIGSTPDGETVRQYLVTAGALTRYDLAQWTLRAELCEPAMSAEQLLMTDFAAGWTHLDRLGVAVMPTAGLDAHAERKGWRWTTDEITEGLAASAQDVAAIGDGPVPAYLLGHDVGADAGERLQAVVGGAIARDADGVVRWDGPLPDGCAGGPVFIGLSLGDDRFRLLCVGLALPGEGANEIVTFDRIRTAVDGLAPVDGHTSVDGPAEATLRRWWQRRRR